MVWGAIIKGITLPPVWGCIAQLQTIIKKILWDVNVAINNGMGILLLTDASQKVNKAIIKKQLEIQKLKAII